MMTAVPEPSAVTMPPGDPGVPPELVSTGNTLGAEEIQVTWLVRSLTCGELANVPMARKFPVSCKLPTVMLLGIIVSESSGSGACVEVTVTDAVADTTLASGFVHIAVIPLEPALTPVTSPEALTVAMVGMLELHWMLVELVTFSWSPVLPDVPRAMNWPV
jgi:hypothetical protein